MEILSVVQVNPNCAESTLLIIGTIVAWEILIINFYAFCIEEKEKEKEKGEIDYATIGTLCLAAVLIIVYIILGLMRTSPVEAKVKFNDISVQEYQNMAKDLDTYTLEKNVLTMRMPEQDFYRWDYERHEATISAPSNSSIESKNGL